MTLFFLLHKSEKVFNQCIWKKKYQQFFVYGIIIFIVTFTRLSAKQSCHYCKKGLKMNSYRLIITSLYWAPVVKDWNKWVVKVITKTDTPFHTIPFNLIVNFHNNYSQSNPLITFQQPHKIFHPNICWIKHKICSPTLDEVTSTTFTRQRIDYVIQLLKNPNGTFLNRHAGQELKKNKMERYFRRALCIYRGQENNFLAGR